MLIFLHSPSHRLINEQLTRLTAAFQKKAGARAQVIKWMAEPDSTAADLLRQIGGSSLFATKQLVVVRHAAALRAAELGILVDRLKKKDLSADTTVVFVELDPLPAQTKNKLIAFLKKKSAAKSAAKKVATIKVLDVEAPTGRAATSDLNGRAKDKGVTFSATLAAELVSRLQGDYDRILYELDGLIAFALSKKDRTISAAEIKQSNEANLEADIFATVGALSSRGLREALQLLHRHLANGAHPLYLLTMMRYQFRVLILVQAAQQGSATQPPVQNARDIAAITGLPWFVVNKAQGYLRGFGNRNLRQIFDKLVDADEAIKTSRIDGDVALDLLTVAICG